MLSTHSMPILGRKPLAFFKRFSSAAFSERAVSSSWWTEPGGNPWDKASDMENPMEHVENPIENMENPMEHMENMDHLL